MDEVIRNQVSWLSGLLLFISFIPYTINIVRHRNVLDKNKPVIATWLLYFCFDIINVLGMEKANALNGLAMGALLGSTVTMVLAFLYGKPGWNIFDKICLFIGIIAIILWSLSDNPEYAIIFSCLGLFVASFPTFISVKENPIRESRATWTIDAIACILATLAIPQWDINNAFQPLTFLLIVTVMVWFLWLQPVRISSKVT